MTISKEYIVGREILDFACCQRGVKLDGDLTPSFLGSVHELAPRTDVKDVRLQMTVLRM